MNTQTNTATKRTATAAKSRKVTNSKAAASRRTANEPQPISEVLPEAVEEIKQTRTARQEAARQRRAELKATSNLLKNAVKTGQIPPSEDGTINGLLRAMYAQQGHTELKTFDEWKQAGYIVRKGQKAILLWGKPRKANREKQAATEAAPTAESTEAKGAAAAGKDEQDEFFPVCYVFSNLQVHPITDKAQA